STVKGLKQLFPSKVEVYTLDPESTKRRGVRDAQELYLSYEQIEVEDIKLCSRDLGLSDAALDNANILYSEFGKSWIVQLLNMTNDEIEMFCD
ncbi:MAG: ATPase, partial [Nostoc sp.]